MQSLIRSVNVNKKLRCSLLNLNHHGVLLFNNYDNSRSNFPNNNNNNVINQFNSTSQRRNFSILSVREWVIESIANSFWIDYTQKALISLHDTIGLPWFVEIIFASLLARIACLPFLIYEKKLMARMENQAIPELKQRKEQIQELTTRKLILRELKNEEAAQKYSRIELRKAKQEIYIKYGVVPGKRILLLSFPFFPWIVMSFSIGGLSASTSLQQYFNELSVLENILHARPQVQNEGCLWFQDLTQTDPYYLLPIIFSAFLFSSFQYNRLVKQANFYDESKILNRIIVSFSILIACISTITPSGVALFWTSNVAFGIVQQSMILNPKVKKLLRIPDTTYNKSQPGFKDFSNHIKDKFENLGSKITRRFK